MPRYFFDIHDGQELTVDEIGVVCESEKEVRDEPIKALPETAKDDLPDGAEHLFWVKCGTRPESLFLKRPWN